MYDVYHQSQHIFFSHFVYFECIDHYSTEIGDKEITKSSHIGLQTCMSWLKEEHSTLHTKQGEILGLCNSFGYSWPIDYCSVQVLATTAKQHDRQPLIQYTICPRN